ncbi:MAG TPA: transcription antitermination factor NusB [Chitinophagaceae bacterium]|nr:transcription antitermination factor NusB [Chitinophagaceae bacterium]
MQTLYSIESVSSEIRAGEPRRILRQNIEQSRNLFTYLVYFIAELARFAEKDAAKRAQKHLPTASDLNINTKIAGNEIIWAILENDSFQKSADHFKIKSLIDDDLVKKLYQLLIRSAEYEEYIQLPSRDKKSEKKIIEFIFSNLMLPEEAFISSLEERYMNWDDDAEMMIVLMNGLLQKPSAFNFREIAGKEKMEFATELLQCVIDKKEYCLELIKPKLKNWDPERIAALDMILMEMGVCEFLYFETIPPKVTINEYIDLAKEYSTEQSGHFVNGMLDNIHKELAAQDKIHKKNFKNSTL